MTQRYQTAKKNTYPTLLIIREIHIKTKMQQLFHTHQNSYNEKHNIPSSGRIWSNMDPHTLQVGVKTGTPNLKTVGQDLIKLHIYQPYEKTSSLLGNTCTCPQKAFKTMLKAALSVIIQTWKHTTCPLTAEWINIPELKHYSTVRMNKLLLYIMDESHTQETEGKK